MKIFKIILTILVCSLTLSSCKKYLDVNYNSRQGVVQTAADCQLLLDNYTVMNTGYPTDGEISADDYYVTQQSYEGSNFNAEDRAVYIWSTSVGRSSSTPNWKSPYQVVFYANLVLETVQKLQGGSTDPVTLNTLKGSALFFRAYAFWNVAQLYTKAYSTGTANEPGIPLRMSSDIQEKSERGTIQQTYDRILQDLKDAVTLLPTISSIASRPNRAAAYAMLARTYLSMEDYPDALNAASATLQLNNQLMDYNTILQNPYTPFSPRFNKEVIFHSITQRSTVLQPGYDGSSNVAKIDSTLASSYEDNDLRSKIFIQNDLGDGSFRFSGNYEPVFMYGDLFTGLAVDEIFLIRAECYARANNINAAMTDLNTLLSTRWATGTYVNMTASSADDGLTKILKERRKELLMRGLRWTDLRRLNKDSRFAKTLVRNINGNTYSLPPNDPRYTLLIPTEVINYSGLPQNSR
jgi:tetratricopeptide (TPR) repeat protein